MFYKVRGEVTFENKVRGIELSKTFKIFIRNYSLFCWYFKKSYILGHNFINNKKKKNGRHIVSGHDFWCPSSPGSLWRFIGTKFGAFLFLFVYMMPMELMYNCCRKHYNIYVSNQSHFIGLKEFKISFQKSTLRLTVKKLILTF